MDPADPGGPKTSGSQALLAATLCAVSVETREELHSAKLLGKKLSVVDVLKVDWKPAFSRAELL
jgi:hypothetical protein